MSRMLIQELIRTIEDSRNPLNLIVEIKYTLDSGKKINEHI